MKDPEEMIIMQVYLSGGELREIQRIAEKSLTGITEREFLFVMEMAARTTRMPIKPRPPLIKTLISKNDLTFKVVCVEPNNHLNN
jgi:hypothetical protein